MQGGYRCGNCCACRGGMCGHTGPCSSCQPQINYQINYPQQHTNVPRCECHSCTQYRASQTPFYTGPKPDEKKD